MTKKNLKVEWENEFQSSSPLDAAKEAAKDIAEGLTTMFTVTDMETNEQFSVDLNEEDEDAVVPIKSDAPKEDSKYDRACEILRSVLCKSGMENDFDQDIYNFLKENDELPEGYKPYWEEDEL